MFDLFVKYLEKVCHDCTPPHVFQILETVDEFKQEISDNSYKKIVDLLKKIHYL